MIKKDVEYEGAKGVTLAVFGTGDIMVTDFHFPKTNKKCVGVTMSDKWGTHEIGKSTEEFAGKNVGLIKPQIVFEITDSKSCDVIIDAFLRAKANLIKIEDGE